MHELLERLQSQSVHLLFDQVLDRLHIVVGRLLDLLDPERIGLAEVAVNVAQLLHSSFVHAGELGQRQFAQRDEILHLHQHTVADQRIFGEIIGQHLALVAVAAVDRGYSGQLCQYHVFHSVLTDYKYRFNPVHCKIITKTSSARTQATSTLIHKITKRQRQAVAARMHNTVGQPDAPSCGLSGTTIEPQPGADPGKPRKQQADEKLF